MPMRLRLVCASILLAGLASSPLCAQADAPTGYRADLLRDITGIEEKIVGLAKAIPADQYGWRPSEGVRSISEAMMHLAAANYFFPTLFGTAVPSGVDMSGLEKITDQEQVVATLESSFEHLRTLVRSTPEDKLDDAIKLFGQDATVAGGLHFAVSHGHEHLGQLIAYARSIGVTPPWSE
ncbi:MAG TPA: DinB family protein [Thermoanaerobaculia bacterium]|nr:DinB family protein [Thermoanaerobaculia bacterium]